MVSTGAYNRLSGHLREATGIRIASASICRDCPAFGVCTTIALHRRTAEIGIHEAALRGHRSWMATGETQRAYRRHQGGLKWACI